MRQRPASVVLIMLALVGSLVLVPVGPVAGKDGEPDYLAKHSACVGPATAASGFSDVPSGSVSEAAINCMAYYGIIPGVTSTTFTPRVGVTREQMALFLIRAAGPAGVDVPAARNYGFEDIGDLPRSTQSSINQLVALGITSGTTDRTFSPDDVVSRRQMAVFLTRFLEVALVGPGGYRIERVVPDDRLFDDIEVLPHTPYRAIRSLYELGVTAGTSVNQFSPDAPVTRAQMAMFMSRMLGHTNARPAGLTMQADETAVISGNSVDYVISVRDQGFRPITDALVEVFHVPANQVGFRSDGRCTSQVVNDFGGDTVCVIDLSDELTDIDGNLPLATFVDYSRTAYAWTGDRSDRFDHNDPGGYAEVEFTVSKPAAAAVLTDDMPAHALAVPFGRAVEFTFQLVDEDDAVVAEEGVQIRVQTIEESDGRRRDRINTYETDETGTVTIRYRLTDPDSAIGSRDGLLKLDVVRAGVSRVIDRSTVKVLTGANRVRWSDGLSQPSVLVLEQSSTYSTASSVGQGGSNRVTATLLDQYGSPERGERVHFISNDQDGLGWNTADAARSAHRRTTNNRGVATVTYYRDSAASGIEAIDAFTEATRTGNRIDASAIDHYWVKPAPRGGTEPFVRVQGVVRFFDPVRDEVVIDGSDGLFMFTYDAVDHFQQAGDPRSMAAFEADLREGDSLVVRANRDEDQPDVFIWRSG